MFLLLPHERIPDLEHCPLLKGDPAAQLSQRGQADHQDAEAAPGHQGKWLAEVLTHFPRCYILAKLKSCRVPSSAVIQGFGAGAGVFGRSRHFGPAPAPP